MATRRPSRRAVKLHRNYTVDEAARVLGISKGTVRRWVKTGLAAITDRKPILILGGDLIAFIDARLATKQRCQLDAQAARLRCGRVRPADGHQRQPARALRDMCHRHAQAVVDGKACGATRHTGRDDQASKRTHSQEHRHLPD